MPEWRYRGRAVTTEEIDFIRRLVAEHPTASRRRLSEKLCEAWQWKQANGAPRDMVCRGLLLMLHRAGQIELPVIRFRPPNPLAQRERPQPMLIDTTPLDAPLSAIRPILLQQVRKTADESLFNSLLEQHHYLGYEQPVGEHLKYLVWAHGRPIACMAWSSASASPGQPRSLYRLEATVPSLSYGQKYSCCAGVVLQQAAKPLFADNAMPFSWQQIRCWEQQHVSLELMWAH